MCALLSPTYAVGSHGSRLSAVALYSDCGCHCSTRVKTRAGVCVCASVLVANQQRAKSALPPQKVHPPEPHKPMQQLGCVLPPAASRPPGGAVLVRWPRCCRRRCRRCRCCCGRCRCCCGCLGHCLCHLYLQVCVAPACARRQSIVQHGQHATAAVQPSNCRTALRRVFVHHSMRKLP